MARFIKKCTFEKKYRQRFPALKRKHPCQGIFETIKETKEFCPNCQRVASYYTKLGLLPAPLSWDEQEKALQDGDKTNDQIKLLTYRQFLELPAEKIYQLGVYNEDFKFC